MTEGQLISNARVESDAGVLRECVELAVARVSAQQGVRIECCALESVKTLNG